jgi:hypothetical protein
VAAKNALVGNGTGIVEEATRTLVPTVATKNNKENVRQNGGREFRPESPRRTIQPHRVVGTTSVSRLFYFQPEEICRLLQSAGFKVGQVIEREPYAPDAEHQSRRAYITARKPATQLTQDSGNVVVSTNR